MKKIFTILAMGLLMLPLHAEDKVLLTIAGEPVTESEFNYIYEKNNQDEQVEKKTREEYLELFINFKLKVKEGLMLGKDTTEAFKQELAGYRAQAAQKYLKDEVAIDSLVALTYDRLCRDRRAAHIVIRCPKDANDSVKAEALAKINDVRLRVTTGKPVKTGKGKKAKTVCVPEDFHKVALEVSEDPNIQENGGELGWITVFRYVYPFEEAVYNTPVGGVSEVFQSNFGYHIALVEEERAHEEVSARHIMRMAPITDAEKAATARHEIDSLLQLLKNGADFAELAMANSADKGSAIRGGDLGWFGRGAMVKPFEEAVFALKDSGDLSEPIQTRYGWHIIQLEGRRGIQSFEAEKESLARRVAADQRIEEAEKSFLRKTRAEYNLPETMSDIDVMAYADQHLEEKYEDFRMLVQEYHDGILLFDVSLDEVWDKASADEAGLKAFFKKNRKNYKWEQPKWKGFILECKNEQVAKAAKAIVKSAPRDSVESLLNQRINLDSVTYVKARFGYWDKAPEVKAKEELPVVVLVGKMLKNPEEYRDERTAVVTDYQDELERQWVANLRKKYPVVINE